MSTPISMEKLTQINDRQTELLIKHATTVERYSKFIFSFCVEHNYSQDIPFQALIYALKLDDVVMNETIMLLACILLAVKMTKNYYLVTEHIFKTVSPEQSKSVVVMSSGAGITLADVIEQESFLLKKLDFDLFVQTPLKWLQIWIDEIYRNQPTLPGVQLQLFDCQGWKWMAECVRGNLLRCVDWKLLAWNVIKQYVEQHCFLLNWQTLKKPQFVCVDVLWKTTEMSRVANRSTWLIATDNYFAPKAPKRKIQITDHVYEYLKFTKDKNNS